VALAVSVGTTLGLTTYFRLQSAADSLTTLSATSDTGATTASGSGAAPDAGTTATSDSGSGAATSPSTTGASTAATAAATASTTAATAAAVTATGLADGTYTGATSTNRWGPVQVAIVVSGGEITEVSVLQYPDGDAKSIAINSRALPYLIEETLSAQSADVDTVSGATYTSDSYQASLQSAIDAARAASAG
jgi:uncharacterized protein with FMN-binding domain